MEAAWRKLTGRHLENTCNLKDLVAGHEDVAVKMIVVVVVKVEGVDGDARTDGDGELGTKVGVESPLAGLDKPLELKWAGDCHRVTLLGTETIPLEFCGYFFLT